jgi:hypothetical protein
MQEVCVGPEFAVDGSGKLTLANLPSAAWPFASGSAVPASMRAANALRVDPQSGLWVPQTGVVPVTQVTHLTDGTTLTAGQALTDVYEMTLDPWYLTNPSAYQQMAFTGWIEFALALFTNNATWAEQWTSAAYAPSPDQDTVTSPWQPATSVSPAQLGNIFVWHACTYMPVQMVVDVADQAELAVRHGVREVFSSGTSVPAVLRDWWVGLYGVTYLLDPGPVG